MSNYETSQAPAEHTAMATVLPRYNLTPEEYRQAEASLVQDVRAAYGHTLGAVWLSSDSGYANAVRTEEATHWPEMEDIMQPYEQSCRFLALVDARDAEQGRLVHGYRVSMPDILSDAPDSGLRIAFIQDLVESGQITEDDISGYYASTGTDLSTCMSVESNFRIGDRAEAFNGVPVPQLGYLCLFNRLTEKNTAGQSFVFAHLNKVARISLGHMGVQHEPFAGREDLQTPSTNGFDTRFSPVAIPVNEHNRGIFTQLSPLAPQTMEV